MDWHRGRCRRMGIGHGPGPGHSSGTLCRIISCFGLSVDVAASVVVVATCWLQCLVTIALYLSLYRQSCMARSSPHTHTHTYYVLFSLGCRSSLFHPTTSPSAIQPLIIRMSHFSIVLSINTQNRSISSAQV